MTAKFQLVIDCADPEPLARFWVAALGYEFEPPPDGYDNWDDYWRAVGVSEDELGLGLDCIVDPAGRGPRIWFQVVPEKKTLKNRLHLDITVSGGRANPIETRRRLVDAEARRLEALGATLVRVIFEDGVDHYGVAMRDPEGNEFDINLRPLAGRGRRGSHDGQGVGVGGAGVQEVVGPLGHVRVRGAQRISDCAIEASWPQATRHAELGDLCSLRDPR